MEKKIFSILFVVVLLFMMCLSLFPICHKINYKIQHLVFHTPNEAPQPYSRIPKDAKTWAELYPYSISYDEYVNTTDPDTNNIKDEVVNFTQNSTVFEINNLKKLIEQYTNTGISGSTYFNTFKKSLDKALGLDMDASLYDPTSKFLADHAVTAEDGLLAQSVVPRDMESILNYINYLKDFSEKQNINFLYLFPPDKHGSSYFYNDNYNILEKELIAGLECRDIDYINYGMIFDNMGLRSEDIFYQTDHHWKSSTGLLANKILAEHLNENYGYNIDTELLNRASYTEKIFSDIFLGSLGRKCSLVYADKEDFSIYYPKYPTDLDVSINAYNISGTISETLLDDSVIEKALNQNYFPDANCYGTFGYADNALIQIHNNLLHDGSNVMLIKTSFANCMFPYLSSVFENLTVVDLRHFDGSLQKLIQEKSQKQLFT